MNLEEEIKKLDESIKKAQEVKEQLEKNLKKQNKTKIIIEEFKDTIPKDGIFYRINDTGFISKPYIEFKTDYEDFFNYSLDLEFSIKRREYIRSVNLAEKVYRFLKDRYKFKLDWHRAKKKYCWVYDKHLCLFKLDSNLRLMESQIYFDIEQQAIEFKEIMEHYGLFETFINGLNYIGEED